jgi:hypothetical protein
LPALPENARHSPPAAPYASTTIDETFGGTANRWYVPVKVYDINISLDASSLPPLRNPVAANSKKTRTSSRTTRMIDAGAANEKKMEDRGFLRVSAWFTRRLPGGSTKQRCAARCAKRCGRGLAPGVGIPSSCALWHHLFYFCHSFFCVWGSVREIPPLSFHPLGACFLFFVKPFLRV